MELVCHPKVANLSQFGYTFSCIRAPQNPIIYRLKQRSFYVELKNGLFGNKV